MADEARTPLLDAESRGELSSTRPRQPARSLQVSSESTPLLLRHDDDSQYGTEPNRRASPSSRTSSPDRDYPKSKRKCRWPTIISLTLLSAAVVTILVFAFAVPAVVKEYAEEAAVFQPTEVSVDSVADDDVVRARIRGDFVLDAKRVNTKSVRDIGRFATWIAREIETGPTEVQVYLPEYSNVHLGKASIPSIHANIRSGHVNRVDFFADLSPGDLVGIRRVADDWLAGRLGGLSVEGVAKVSLKSGLLNFGAQVISRTLRVEGHQFPTLPKINITKLNFYDANSTSPNGAMAVDVLLNAMINTPLNMAIPPLGFDVLVPNCSPGEPYILVANAHTDQVDVNPGLATDVHVSGLVERLPDELTNACPGQKNSPLDVLVANYIHGLENTIYVRGAESPSPGAPGWMVDFLKDFIIPVPFTGQALGDLVKNFSMTDVHFSLPDPFAEPDTPEAQPKISAQVKVLISLPEQMNFRVDTPRVRANADVFYLSDKLGELDLHEWSPANSSQIEDSDGQPALFVEFQMKDAPLQVTDEDVFADVIQALLFGQSPIELRVAAAVDAEVVTALGQFAVHDIPAEGKVAVKVPSDSGPLDQLKPRVEALKIQSTNETSLLIRARVNVTNPTLYSATVPLADVMVLFNGVAVAHVTARDVSIVPGPNTGVDVELLWNPRGCAGHRGVTAGRKMLSQYVSGENTTVTVQTHQGTIPAIPGLGRAMSKLGINIRVPRVPIPRSPDGDDDGDDDDREDRPHFIQDAILHLFSSTAEFTISSPLPNTTMFITSINATAYYEQTERIGNIVYNLPFEVPPGISQTPRLPVDLNYGGIGYEAVKRALGGTLKMDAIATVGVRIQQYTDILVYHGKGIGAKIRI